MFRIMKITMFACLISLLSLGGGIFAQDAAPQSFTVLVGGSAIPQIDVMDFAPHSLKIYRGDTVTWIMAGFHNVSFNTTVLPLVIAPMVDGNPTPQLNPDVVFPQVPDNGVYTGGIANSGLPVIPNASPTFTLTFDVAPGTYTYYCDVHPGMTGEVVVVPDDEQIPSPGEAAAQGSMEMGKNINDGMAAYDQAMADAQDQMMAGADGGHVAMGPMTGKASIDAFFPYSVTIHAGQSVTWTMSGKAMDMHTVTSLPLPSDDQEFIPQAPQGNNPPVILLGSVMSPSTPSGSTVKAGDSFNSGLMKPGEDYTLTFADPGVYPYGCFLHPGMLGVVVVLPATGN